MTTAGHIRFNWENYIAFSEEVFNSIPSDKDDETKERCIISRAYYGAFNVARNYLVRKNQTIDVTGKGSHEEVISCFDVFGKADKIFGEIALELRNLKALRIAADYQDKFFSTFTDRNKILKNVTKLALLRARKIINWIYEIEKQELL